jgi:hypothetical protein
LVVVGFKRTQHLELETRLRMRSGFRLVTNNPFVGFDNRDICLPLTLIDPFLRYDDYRIYGGDRFVRDNSELAFIIFQVIEI